MYLKIESPWHLKKPVKKTPVSRGPEWQQPSNPQGDVRDLGFHLKWNMGFTYDAVSLFSADFNERTKLETFGWKRLAWWLGERARKRLRNVIHWALLEFCWMIFPHLSCQRFLNYAFNERLENLSKTHILLCHGLAHGAVTTFSCDQVDPSLLTWQHASKELGGSDGRGWRYGWWLQICTSACSILATCLFLEGDDIFDICPLVYDVKFCFSSSMHLSTTAQVYHWYVGAAFAFYGLRDWWLAAFKAFKSCGQPFTDVVLLCPTRWCTRSGPSHRRHICKT